MGVVRRFLTLIVDNHVSGTKSLHRIDLNRHKLFNTAAAFSAAESSAGIGKKKKQAASVALELGRRISLPRPHINFRALASDLNDLRMHCFLVADSMVFYADQMGRGFIFEADAYRVVTMPLLHTPKLMPISLFIPSADLDDDEVGRGSFFIMERIPKPELGCTAQGSYQFQAFLYGRTSWSYENCWSSLILPPPPYIRDSTSLHCPEISSYAVVGSDICISVDGVGTFCLDTVNYTWREVAKWTLPFYGKIEYVAELKLWFGFSAKDRHFAAADLSVLELQPQLLATLKDLDVPEESKECKDPQIAYLGSGKFCVSRFFHTKTPSDNFKDDQSFAVLTGVVVVAHGNGSDGNVRLRMIKHKSRCHKSNGSNDVIIDVF